MEIKRKMADWISRFHWSNFTLMKYFFYLLFCSFAVSSWAAIYYGDLTLYYDGWEATEDDFGITAMSSPPTISGNFGPAVPNPYNLTDVDDRLAPTFGDLDNDGDLDLIWGSEYARLGYIENIGTATAPNFGPNQTLPFGLTDQGNESRPRLVDLDNDGDLDLMIAVNTGLTYFENIGTVTAPSFGPAQTNPFGIGNLGQFRSTPTFGDLDNDGDLDLIVGANDGFFVHIENIGTAAAPNFDFANRTTNPFNLTPIGNNGNASTPYLVDWDYDGDLDLVASEISAVINYFENTGTAAAPNFAPVQESPFCLSSPFLIDGIETVDLDGDGDQDIVIGNNGGFYFFEGNTFAEIDVRGNGRSIADGDMTPSTADHTDFGDAVLCLGQSIQRTFTIDNAVGNLDLNVNNVISSNPDFLVSGITTPLVLTPGSSTTFEVTFTPTALGVASSSITINNDDCDEAPYTFSLQGNGALPTTEARGDALDFDGVDDFVEANGFSLPLNSAITVEFWINSPGGGTPTNFTIGGSLSDRCLANVPWSDNLLYWDYGDINAGGRLTTDFTPYLNQWTHVALVSEGLGGNFKGIYLNGVLVASANNSSGPSMALSSLRLGAQTPTVGHADQTMDEFRVWNVVRTEQEIRENMHLTLSGCETDLLAYYQMNDGSGSTTLTDRSSHGHNGTLLNMAPANDWMPSGVNVGNDVPNASNSETIVAVPTEASTQIFTSANLQMRFFAHSTLEDYTVTYQAFAPNAIMGVNGVQSFQNPMWTVNKSTTTSTQLVDYTFNFPPATFTSTDPSKYSLYWRPMYADGPWTKVATANTVTSTTALFGKISLTGQFMVVQESEDLVSDVRGNMYEFDAVNNSISAPFILDPNTTNFSVEMWFKIFASATNRILIIQNTGGGTQGRAFLRESRGRLRTRLGGVSTTGTTLLKNNEWYHGAVTWDGTTLRLYLNGVMEASRNITMESATGDFVIGANETLTTFFGGNMDEIRFWNRALTQAEIRDNMHLTLKGNEAGLLAYYQFNNDDPVGTVGGVKDATGTFDATTFKMTAADYRPSEVAVAGGTSDRATVFAAGLVNFPNTAVDIDFGASTPNGELVVYRLETERPHGWESIVGDVDDEYFIIKNFGTNRTFSALNDLTFNRLSHVSASDVGLPQATSPLQLYKRPDNAFGPTWGPSFGGADLATAGSNASISYNASNNLTSFSQIVLVNTGPNTDLPVELLAFNAERATADQVALQWTTATELNNKGFYIERLLEGENAFQTVGFVEGAGTTLKTTHYSFVDDNSYPNVSYYRLRQVDFDGTTSYSDTRAVSGNTDVALNPSEWVVYPNPVADVLHVRFNDLPEAVTTATVRIQSLDGQVLHQFETNIQSYQVLHLDQVQQLVPAVYTLSIALDNGEVMTYKLIKM